MIVSNWAVMRAEANILIERIRTGEPGDPEMAELVERANTLQKLGWEAWLLYAQTETFGRKH